MPNGKFEQIPAPGELSSEEEEELFEATKGEMKLGKTLDGWIESQESILHQRAQHFGLKDSIVKGTQDELKFSFNLELADIATAKGFNQLKEASYQTIANLLENNKELKEGVDLLSSRKDFLNLLNRKLEGGITSRERDLLDLFSYVKYKGVAGSHDLLTKEIRISLFNQDNLKELTAILSHEFTHKALFSLLPEALSFKDILCRSNKNLGEKEGEEEKVQSNFSSVLGALNESLAYRSERYFGRQTEPDYLDYQKVTYPGIFKKIYEQINTASEEKSLEEFDKFAAHIYTFYTSQWRENLTGEELKEIVKGVVQEIHKFK